VTHTAFGISPVGRFSSRVSEIDDEKRREVVDLQRRFVYLPLDL
jgi:hypothetical protein